MSLERVYVANHDSNSVTFLLGQNLSTNTIPVAFKPCGVVADRAHVRVYVTDGDEVTIINMEQQAVAKTIKVGTQAEFAALNRKGNRLYVPNFRDDTLSVIATIEQGTVIDKVINVVPVSSQPHAAAVSPSGARVYVTNSGWSQTVCVLDAAALDDPNGLPLLATISLKGVPRGIAIDREGKHVYVACQTINSVAEIDAEHNIVTSYIKVGRNPIGIAITPDDKELWVANVLSNNVSVVDRAKQTTIKRIRIPHSPSYVCIAGPLAYVSESNGNRLVVIERASYKVVDSYRVGTHPEGVAVA